MCREIVKQCCPVDVPTRMETVYTYTTNTGCLAHALACFYRSQTHLSREDAVRNGSSPPTSIISQDQSPPQTWPQANLIKTVLQLRLPFPS